MHDGPCQFRCDQVAKFYRALRLFGWFHAEGDPLARLYLEPAPGSPPPPQHAEVGLPHQGVASLGPTLGFSLDAMLDRDAFPADARLVFTTRSGREASATLGALASEAATLTPTTALLTRLQQAMAALPNPRLLDIGGRARSGISRRALFPNAHVTVLDVIADPSVDVTGDAHALSRLFPPDSFDGILSVSVFEHLAMPWTVAVEMHKVLKPGGLAMIFTHQTLGMHDQPWDFWRFSDTAWDALFNRHTGYTILARALDRPHFLIPHTWRPDKTGCEAAAGFEGSAALVEKTGPCKMSWPLTAADITSSHYPKA